MFFFRENCDLKAAKHFRLNYRRPYYLPQMAEAAKMNSFLVAKGQSEEPVAVCIINIRMHFLRIRVKSIINQN